MTVVGVLLMITLGRPEVIMPISPNQLVVNDQNMRSLWAAPAWSVWPPLDTPTAKASASLNSSHRIASSNGPSR